MTTIEDQIIKVEKMIEKVEQQIASVEEELAEKLTQDDKTYLRDEKKQLRDEKKQLREKEKQLRDEKKQPQQDAIEPSVWKALVPSMLDLPFPSLQCINENQEEHSTKRNFVELPIEATSKEEDGKKRRKLECWTASRKPVAVESPAKWYLGKQDSELFIRQCTLDCFKIIWEAVEKSKKEWAEEKKMRCVAFIITGPPGLGKSWSSNTIVWRLLKERQNMWFHSASDHTLTTIEFKDDDVATPTIVERREEEALHKHPPAKTWFLYDSVGGSGALEKMIPFTEQPEGVPCVIFSSPKDTNYKQGIKNMKGGPGGGKVWELWTPSWEWHELESVMPSLHKESGGKSKTEDEFKGFIHSLFLLWGGIPRRFNEYCQSFRDEGKDAALEMSRTHFKMELSQLSVHLARNGPLIYHEMLDSVGQSGESESSSRKVAPPSWLVFPFPSYSVEKPFRERIYRFCSQKAELAFWDNLEKQEVDVVRKFCLDVFAVPGSSGIAFERFAHFVLTRTESNKFSWKKYGIGSEVKTLKLPKCEQQKCGMKTDLTAFQDAIKDCVRLKKCVVIDPESDQQDAIDMFVVSKLDKRWRVLAMQDTISKTHSFHPVKILEYRTAAKKALQHALGRKNGVLDNYDFFLHVVVVPTEDPGSPFRLQAATMAKLDDVDSVKAKFDEIGEPVFTKWNATLARDACQSAKLKNYTTLSRAALLTAGAEVSLLQAAEAKVKGLTWVLDGFLNDR